MRAAAASCRPTAGTSGSRPRTPSSRASRCTSRCPTTGRSPSPGLRSTWTSPEGERIGSCTIITGPANRVGGGVHDRMPVVLPGPEERAAWLDPALDAAAVMPLLGPLPDELTRVQRASTRVNAATYDAPDCLNPDEDPPQETQLTLAI